jgi:guanine nucleotide-binding protein G(i) subunit alpha
MKTLTQLSRMIQWLRYLFYIRLFRKQSDLDMPTEQDYLDAAALMRSEAIDRRLAEEATSLHRETKLVLMGAPNSGKELIMRQMKVLYAEGYPREERLGYRHAVRSTVRLFIHAMIDLIKDTGINLPKDLNHDFAILLYEVETVDMKRISQEACTSIQKLWSSPTFSTLYVRNFEIDFPHGRFFLYHHLSYHEFLDPSSTSHSHHWDPSTSHPRP